MRGMATSKPSQRCSSLVSYAFLWGVALASPCGKNHDSPTTRSSAPLYEIRRRTAHPRANICFECGSSGGAKKHHHWRKPPFSFPGSEDSTVYTLLSTLVLYNLFPCFMEMENNNISCSVTSGSGERSRGGCHSGVCPIFPWLLAIS